MTARSGAWVLGAIVALAGPGCSLPRGSLGGEHDGGAHDVGPGRIDGGGIDTGPIDGGPDSGTCPTSCDDGNACTTDGCDSAGACTHTANAAACDDGVLCNGADTCGASTCSVHAGSPCPAPSHCDIATDTCTGCVTTGDCPMPMPGPWGACEFGSDLCTITGTQTRATMTFTCSPTGTCDAVPTTETQPCMRTSTDGIMCAAPAYGVWSACDFGTDPCTQAGMMRRTVTTSHCAGGTCVGVDGGESDTCMRMPTDGMSCGPIVVGDWSTCMGDRTCSAIGTRTQSTTTSTCMGGTCNTMTTIMPDTCMIAGGGACGATTCGAWGTCTQTMTNTCDRTGTQSRTCTTQTCVGPTGGTGTGFTCTGTSMTTESQPCSASVVGVACGASMTCGACHELFGCASGHNGTQTCATSHGTCADFGLGPYCNTSTSYSSRSCVCP